MIVVVKFGFDGGFGRIFGVVFEPTRAIDQKEDDDSRDRAELWVEDDHAEMRLNREKNAYQPSARDERCDDRAKEFRDRDIFLDRVLGRTKKRDDERKNRQETHESKYLDAIIGKDREKRGIV